MSRYENRTVRELAQLARSRGIPVAGLNKKGIINKLRRKNGSLKRSRKSPKRRRSLEDKYESCVLQVKAKGSAVNPWAVCRASVYH